jgi:DNA-binding NtrC family response regulator
MQVTLLRALQEKTVRPVGGSEDQTVDVRVVAATNRSLAELVDRGLFRQDLLFRLNVVTVHLPPLRERSGDIPLLVDHFLDVIAVRMGRAKKGLTRRALKRLVDQSWPGNVRQLEHVLTNASVMADGEILDAADIDAALGHGGPAASTPAQSRRDTEKQQILQALEASGWNKTRACQKLGIPRRTFYRRLADHGIQ